MGKQSVTVVVILQIFMTRVNKPVIDAWVHRRITELLGVEDDVVSAMVAETLTTEVRRLLRSTPCIACCSTFCRGSSCRLV
jgi:hypothetical protein